MLNPEVQSAFAEAAMDVSERWRGRGTAPATAETKPQSAESAQPAEPAQPAQPASSVGSAIVHTAVTASAVGQPIVIQAEVPASLAAERVVLAYRPDGASDFVTREMDAVEGSDAYQSQIPAEATSGASVAYYIQAQDGRASLLAQQWRGSRPAHRQSGRQGRGGGIINGVTENETSNEGEEAVKAGKARRTGLPWPLVAAVATTRVRPKQTARTTVE